MSDPPDEDRRLDDLVDQIVQLAAGDLSVRLEPSPARDSVDAVITGFNLLADELDMMYRTLEQRVAERTAELAQAKQELERLALYDPLTGLANRSLLADRMGQAVARAERGAGPPAVLLLDLDEFKTINDGLGHTVGDLLLVEIARRLTAVVRDTDTVARLGGDEFAILLPDIDEVQALRIAERALAELQKPFAVGDRAVWPAASIGICFGTRGQSADLLLRDADTAMYAAKASGKGTVQVFRPEMHHAARARLQIASELGSAVAQDQLRLMYQPIVDLRSGVPVGAEALVRWQHPTRGLLQPVDFIGVAESSGHIVDIGHWVLRTAIAELEHWPDRPSRESFKVHVNLLPVEVRWPGLAELVADTLREHAVPAGQLVLEISETGLMTGDIGDLEALLALRRLGSAIAIDDFGTGYSSISYLRRLPIDSVKVDQSLIADITTDPTQVRFVGAILQLIEAAGLAAVVEGIESVEQMNRLTELGCRYGQGFLFGRPVPWSAIMSSLLGPTRPAVS
ncbi:putative bifunctional diguanylate cyclase/phosphodiesterase [Nakamurella sp.]|uniref:putative bifunctional diguanylate cyclase/phosphodiesterase n=1 Tax=Nakamurella sp. TaxID=1869182 RepID=UPI0037851FC0